MSSWAKKRAFMGKAISFLPVQLLGLAHYPVNTTQPQKVKCKVKVGH